MTIQLGTRPRLSFTSHLDFQASIEHSDDSEMYPEHDLTLKLQIAFEASPTH
ncbi:hypothetical protein M378DRAFT_162606 [Amanita muscaria Koide BX008]|uniref:Uncharacterized protein n=1 Tax=Amanita muscaria (strain Koide BX008) TaxID=946122 RepID=A0A0C2X8H0_AMAMK|nr:hypothetical protein M378DRAFT_162606 [Amanita muscaria Koide BX008]